MTSEEMSPNIQQDKAEGNIAKNIDEKSSINEQNFKQVLFDFTIHKYGNKLQEFYDKFFNEFPYNYEGLERELSFKNFIDWLMIEKTLPETGKTIIEEYVSCNPDLNNDLKEKLLSMKHVVRSEFIVLSKNNLNLVLKDRITSKSYNVLVSKNVPQVGRNTLITGRIHPFGEYYMSAGAFIIHNSPMILDPEIMMNAFEESRIKEAEAIILSEHSQLTAILNKYPAQWVCGICNALSIEAKGKKNIKAKIIAETLHNNMLAIISSLSDKSKKALKLVLDNEGQVAYGKLKEYDDEINFFWENDLPNSTIGALRVKGLLVVGKMPQNGKMYKTALIPKDIRESIKKIIDTSEDKKLS